jgi:hypothetical protein
VPWAVKIDESSTILTVLNYDIMGVFLGISQQRLVSSLFQNVRLP